MPESTPGAQPSRGRFARLLQRLLHPRLVILETMRPVEVPVLTETKRRWLVGDREGAILYAYEAVLADMQRAYGVQFPPDWTHDDILVHGVTADMGPILPFVQGLHDQYLPLRYGGVVPEGAESPEHLVQSVYAQRAMWSLYVEGVRRDDGAARRAAATDSHPVSEPGEVGA